MSETAILGDAPSKTSPDGLSLSDRARAFAIERHGDQMYGEQPYRTHLFAVVAVLRDYGFDSETWQAAGWLHDVIEDTGTHPDVVDSRFCSDVGALVWAVSGLPGVENTNRKMRNADIYAKLAALPQACILKLADRIANVEASQAGAGSLRRMYAREQEAFAEVVRPHVPPEMWARLERALEAP